MLVRGLKLGSRQPPLLKQFSSSGHLASRKRESDNLTLDHPFAVYDEFRVFETLITSKLHTRDDLPYLKHIRRLREVEHSRQRQRAASHVHRIEGLLSRQRRKAESIEEKFTATQKIKTILKSRSVTVKDLDSFLRIGTAELAARDVMPFLIKALEVMVHACDGETLPVVADLLTTYWTVGFDGQEFRNATEAAHLVDCVLARSLEIYPETVYTIEHQAVVPEYGTERVESFRHFIDGYVDIFETENSEQLYDKLFRLAARSGSIEMADAILALILQKGGAPSALSVETFIKAITHLISAERLVFVGNDVDFTLHVKEEMRAYRDLLVSEQVTAPVIEFLLLWTSSLDEVYSVLEIASQSNFQDDILSRTQIPIINTVVKCGLVESTYAEAMAHMFGTLNRFANCSAGITADAYNECLHLAATYGNSAGMYRAISMKVGLETEGKKLPTPKRTIEHVFDRLPTIDGALAKEKVEHDSWFLGNNLKRGEYSLDLTVLSHLRNEIDPLVDSRVYQKYLGALGRFGLPARLADEHERLFSDTDSIAKVPQDVLVAFIGAFKTVGSYEEGLQLLRKVLESSISHHDGQAISILRQVFRYEILPLKQTVPFIANWFIKHKKVIQWTAQDIEQTFAEIVGSNAVTSLSPEEARAAAMIGKAVSEAVVQVQNGRDVDDSITNLSELLRV